MDEARYSLVDLGVGRPERMVVARLKPGCDFVGGIRDVCSGLGIRAGTITATLGTLERATYRSVVRKPDAKSGVGYSEPMVVEGPIEMIMGQGVISELESGELFVHLHAVFADCEFRVYGGHFDPGGNPVLSTMDVVILEAGGVEVVRKRDPAIDLDVMHPRSKPS